MPQVPLRDHALGGGAHEAAGEAGGAPEPEEGGGRGGRVGEDEVVDFEGDVGRLGGRHGGRERERESIDVCMVERRLGKRRRVQAVDNGGQGWSRERVKSAGSGRGAPVVTWTSQVVEEVG